MIHQDLLLDFTLTTFFQALHLLCTVGGIFPQRLESNQSVTWNIVFLPIYPHHYFGGGLTGFLTQKRKIYYTIVKSKGKQYSNCLFVKEIVLCDAFIFNCQHFREKWLLAFWHEGRRMGTTFWIIRAKKN